MRATPRSRLFNNRVTAAGDEEAQQQASARRRVTGRHSSFYDRNRRLSSRRRRRRRGGVQSLFQCPRGRVTVVIAIATWTVTFPLIRLASTPLPAVTESFGPDSIPSVFRVERRKRHGGPREQRGLGTGSANEGSLRSICLNTAQGVTLLADSEGRVCYRNNTDQDPLRSGCCSTTQPLPHPPLPSDRALSVLADSGDKRKLNLRRTVTSDNYAAASGEVAARRHGDDEVEVVNARAGRLSNGDAFGDDFPPSEALLAPFSCWRCHVSDMDGGSSCCRSYEFCVSCCLDPQRAHEREAIHAAAARSGHPAYGYSGYTNNDLQALKRLPGGASEEEQEAVTQQQREREQAFQHCAFRCRTNSASVAHENSYRGPLKHCFGRYRPPTAPGMSPNSDGSRRNEMSQAGLVAALPQGSAQALELDPLFTLVSRV